MEKVKNGDFILLTQRELDQKIQQSYQKGAEEALQKNKDNESESTAIKKKKKVEKTLETQAGDLRFNVTDDENAEGI